MPRGMLALLCALLIGICPAQADSNASQAIAVLEALDSQELETQGWMRAIWATGEAGAQVCAGETADAPIIATLAPGVFLEGWRRLEGGAILVRLGAGEDGLTGCIPSEGYTWTDNGAHCAVDYPVYQQAGTLVEALGRTADGREIVRRDGAIELPPEWDAQGAVALERQGSYFAYPEPMAGERSDEEIAYEAAQALACNGEPDRLTGEPMTEQALQALTPRVSRLVDPQFGVRTAMVFFEDAQGVCRAVAEVDPASGRVIATDDNG